MKTKVITGLKKEVLVIELPEGYNLDYTYYSEDNETEIAFYLNEDCVQLKTFKGNYTLLGKPDEIKEKDVLDLLHYVVAFKNDNSDYLMWKDYRTENDFETSPLDSFHSALESEIYLENPLANEIHAPDIKEWKEAQEKTFDKKRTLIFVKN